MTAAPAYQHDDQDSGLSKAEKIEAYLGADLPTGLTSSTGQTFTAATSITLDALAGVIGFGGNQSADAVGAVFLEESVTPPTGSLTTGGLLYVSNGSLCYLGTASTTTVLAAP